jgi:hypothetical protein
MTKINRNLHVGINVETAAELPKVGTQLAKFLRAVDVEHGPFDVSIALAVAPTEAAAITPYEAEEEERGPLVVINNVTDEREAE